MISPEDIPAEVDDQAERLVDTRGISYDDAYRLLGYHRDAGSVSGRDQAREAATKYYTDEFNLTGIRTPEQALEAAKAAELGAPAVRAALQASRPEAR